MGEAGVDRACGTGEGASVATLGGGARGGEAIRAQLARGATVRAKVTGRIVDSAGKRYQRTVRIELEYRHVGGEK